MKRPSKEQILRVIRYSAALANRVASTSSKFAARLHETRQRLRGWVSDSTLKSGRYFWFTAAILLLNWVFVTAGPKIGPVERVVAGRYVAARCAFNELLSRGAHQGRDMGYVGPPPVNGEPSVNAEVYGFPQLMEITGQVVHSKYNSSLQLVDLARQQVLNFDGKVPITDIRLVDLRATVSSDGAGGNENILAVQHIPSKAYYHQLDRRDHKLYLVLPTYEEVQAAIKDGIEWSFLWWSFGFTLLSLLAAALCDRVSKSSPSA